MCGEFTTVPVGRLAFSTIRRHVGIGMGIVTVGWFTGTLIGQESLPDTNLTVGKLGDPPGNGKVTGHVFVSFLIEGGVHQQGFQVMLALRFQEIQEAVPQRVVEQRPQPVPSVRIRQQERVGRFGTG